MARKESQRYLGSNPILREYFATGYFFGFLVVLYNLQNIYIHFNENLTKWQLALFSGCG